MCGIAGIAGSEDQGIANKRVVSMLEVLKHRGPDDQGLNVWDRAVLGHRRLSIFDLSEAGHQPMISPDGTSGIVFNGAIYNFRALRKELEDKGFKFRSNTDTEVLLLGYRQWGIDGLVAKIQGMFAFGLWDQTKQALFLVRDRLGVKPLVYSVNGEEIAFASTVRALSSHSQRELNRAGVAKYLEFGFVTDEHSIYRGIEKVAAGEIVEWRFGRITRRKYWDLPTSPPSSKISFEEAVEETETLLLRAVEKRLQADVPVGALLSGGIDSSLVCWAITKLGADVTAFSVGTPNESGDETAVAVETAKTLGIKHRILNISAEKAPSISELVDAYSEPFACGSALGMLAISREVRDSATVLLTGDGGDDVFLGYPEHKHFLMSSALAGKLPLSSSEWWLKTRAVLPTVGKLKRAVSFLDYSFGGLGAVGNARDGMPVYTNNKILGERLRDFSLPDREMEWSVESGRNLLAEFLVYDRKTRFVGEYLPKVDGATMYFGLESRSPFLDTELWEFASDLPFSMRLHNGKSKAILREIARRRIGESVALGKKRGFNIPVQRWLNGRWRKTLIDVLDGSLLEKEGWINAGAAVQLLDKSLNWAPRQLWFILVLESWLRSEKLRTAG
jgi:asparagine synthase (glutamine-hydrolysing)